MKTDERGEGEMARIVNTIVSLDLEQYNMKSLLELYASHILTAEELETELKARNMDDYSIGLLVKGYESEPKR